MRTELEQRCEVHEVITWRHERLAESGFPSPLASDLARDPRFDLHALIELAERGCSPELAVRITAPLDAEGDAA
jgi:hypothetical protein